MPIILFAQAKYDYNLVLGYQSNSDTWETELFNLNFNYPPDNPFDVIDGLFDVWRTTTTMSDSLGNLVFYTNGCQISNANHQLMENGDSLSITVSIPDGDYFFERDCITFFDQQKNIGAYNSGEQSIVALPVPNVPNRFYLIHLLKGLNPNPQIIAMNIALLLTEIDMVANNGDGEVVKKNVPILEEPLASGYMTSVRHADNKRWWINLSSYDSNEHIFILLGENGVDTIQRQTIGPVISLDGYVGGMRVFSPDGTRMAHIDDQAKLVLYNFDRGQGQLSDPFQIALNDRTQDIGGVCFSSNNRYLYAASTDTLYQLDMEAPDIAASKTIVAIYDGYTDPFTLNFYQMERGPDCKIYINSTAGAQNLHVIMSPDSPGLACDVRQHYLQLPFPRERNLLNAPNYRLGTPHPTCDSTINVVSSSTEPIAPPPITDGGVRVFPNPARERATVVFDLPFHGTLTLHDAHGRELLRQTAGGLTEYDLNLGALPGGVYFVRATTREGFVRTVRLVRMSGE